MISLLKDTLLTWVRVLHSIKLTLFQGDYLRKIRERLPFAEGGSVTKLWNSSIEALLGPKTEADLKPQAQRKEHKLISILNL